MPEANELPPIHDGEEGATREDALAMCKSLRQRRFVEAYVGRARGNATEAARIAGYSDESYGREVLTKTHVLKAIRALVRAETLSRSDVRHRISRHATASIADVLDLVDVVQHVAYQPTEADKLAAMLTRSVGDTDVKHLRTGDLKEQPDLLAGLADQLDTSPDHLLDMVGGRVLIARVNMTVPTFNLEKAKRTGAIHAIKSIRYDADGRPEITMHDAQAALIHLDKMYSVADGQPEAETVARSRLERVSEKMGLQINVLNVNL